LDDAILGALDFVVQREPSAYHAAVCEQLHREGVGSHEDEGPGASTAPPPHLLAGVGVGHHHHVVVTLHVEVAEGELEDLLVL
jgi:hypothetical protein